jgi:hypothetical protein
MYSPERRILKYLREYDPELGARWDRDRERWRITRCGQDVLLVQDPDGGYRPLDERVVTKVKLSDSWKWKDAKSFLAALDEGHHRSNQAQRKKALDDFRQMCIEDGPARRHFDRRNAFAGWSA